MIGSVFSFYGYFFTQGAKYSSQFCDSGEKYVVKIVIDEFDKIQVFTKIKY